MLCPHPPRPPSVMSALSLKWRDAISAAYWEFKERMTKAEADEQDAFALAVANLLERYRDEAKKDKAP